MEEIVDSLDNSVMNIPNNQRAILSGQNSANLDSINDFVASRTNSFRHSNVEQLNNQENKEFLFLEAQGHDDLL